MTVLSFVRVLQSAKACRLCRERHEEGNVDVFPSDPIEDASTSNDILEALHKYISLTIKEDDGLGSIICMHCLFTLQLLSELVKDYNTNREKVVANKFDCCYVCSMKTSFFFYGRQYCRYLKKLIKYSQPNVFSDVKETEYVMRRFCKECTFKVETTYKFQKKARLTEKRLRSLPYESDFSSADDESDFERSQNEPEDAMVGSGHIHVSRFGNDAFFYHHRRISPIPRMGSVSPASSTSSLSLPYLEVMASTSTQPTSSTSSSNRPTRGRPPKKKTAPRKKKVQRRRKAKNVNKDNEDSDSDYDNITAVRNRRVTKTSGKVTKKSKRSINRTKIRTSLRLQNSNANSNTSNVITSTQRKNNNGGKTTKKSSRGRRKV